MRSKKGTRIETKCTQCEKIRYRKPWEVERNKTGQFFCDHKCSRIWAQTHSTETILSCCHCGTSVRRKASQIRASENVFCSHRCAAKYSNARRVVSKETKEKISVALSKSGLKKKKAVKSKKEIHSEMLLRFYAVLQGENKAKYSTHKLKLRLFELGIKEELCEECNLEPSWNGKSLALQLHHINGDSADNRLSNLRILCPNCHTQTDSYAGKANKK